MRILFSLFVKGVGAYGQLLPGNVPVRDMADKKGRRYDTASERKIRVKKIISKMDFEIRSNEGRKGREHFPFPERTEVSPSAWIPGRYH